MKMKMNVKMEEEKKDKKRKGKMFFIDEKSDLLTKTERCSHTQDNNKRRLNF